MKTRTKVGRNDPCPCGSGAKYKKCCGFIGLPWDGLLQGREAAMAVRLGPRERNLAFISRAAAALQLDRLDEAPDWRDIKRACTPEAVRKIHEAVIQLWPNEDDYYRLLADEQGNESGIYIGDYEPEHIMRGVSRHAIYSDSIILFDPFLNPRVIAPGLNPLLHPEKHRSSTLKNLYLWISLFPWIEAGLVKIFPSPTDFDADLALETHRAQEMRYKNNPVLTAAMAESAEMIEDLARSYHTFSILHTPDEKLAEDYRRKHPEETADDLLAFLKEVQEMRESHPYFIAGSLGIGRGQGEITTVTSGGSYPIAKMVAEITGSHLITDIPTKWREIQIDRRESGVELGRWTSFAKAFQAVELPFLSNVPLDAALALRKEDRLMAMRTFLRKLWKACRSADEFSEANAAELAGELESTVAAADVEWKQIDRDLLNWVSGGVTASAIAVATGSFLAAAPFVVASATQLVVSHFKRRDFVRSHPASFFMELKRRRWRT